MVDDTTNGAGFVFLGLGGLAVQLAGSDTSTVSTLLEATGGAALGTALAAWVTRHARRSGRSPILPLPVGTRCTSTRRTIFFNICVLALLALISSLFAPEVADLAGFVGAVGVAVLLRARGAARLESETGQRLFHWGEKSRYYTAPRTVAAQRDTFTRTDPAR